VGADAAGHQPVTGWATAIRDVLGVHELATPKPLSGAVHVLTLPDARLGDAVDRAGQLADRAVRADIIEQRDDRSLGLSEAATHAGYGSPRAVS